MNKISLIIILSCTILMGVTTTFAYTPTTLDDEKIAHAISLIPSLDDFQLSGLMGELISGLITTEHDSSQEYRLSTAKDFMDNKIEEDNSIMILADVDGDGIPNIEDTDIDGDGLLNIEDSDMDGDTRSNDIDRDIDGDRLPNQEDEHPNGPVDELEELSSILDQLLAEDDVAVNNIVPENTKPADSQTTPESLDEIGELDDRLDAIKSRIAHSTAGEETEEVVVDTVYEDDTVYTFQTVQDAATAYSEPEPVYVEPEPVYVEPEPVYVEPEPVYVEPEPVPELSDAEMSDIELQILAGRNILDAVQQVNDHALYYNGF